MINFLVTAPKAFALTPTDPANPTQQEQVIMAAVEAIDAQWVEVGESATRCLWAVITRLTDPAQLDALITQYGLPLNVIAAQDAYANPPVVHNTTSKATLLNYMPPEPVIDSVTGNVTGTQPATQVRLPVWAGHVDWAVY